MFAICGNSCIDWVISYVVSIAVRLSAPLKRLRCHLLCCTALTGNECLEREQKLLYRRNLCHHVVKETEAYPRYKLVLHSRLLMQHWTVCIMLAFMENFSFLSRSLRSCYASCFEMHFTHIETFQVPLSSSSVGNYLLPNHVERPFQKTKRSRPIDLWAKFTEISEMSERIWMGNDCMLVSLKTVQQRIGLLKCWVCESH